MNLTDKQVPSCHFLLVEAGAKQRNTLREPSADTDRMARAHEIQGACFGHFSKLFLHVWGRRSANATQAPTSHLYAGFPFPSLWLVE